MSDQEILRQLLSTLQQELAGIDSQINALNTKRSAIVHRIKLTEEIGASYSKSPPQPTNQKATQKGSDDIPLNVNLEPIPVQKTKVGVFPPAGRLLKNLFVEESRPPDTLEEALEKALGENWRDQSIAQPGGFKQSRRSTYSDQLERIRSQKNSSLGSGLANAIKNLERMRDGQINPDTQLSNLYHMVDASTRLPEMREVLKRWGIPGLE